MKQCSRCEITRPLTEFYKHPKCSQGVLHVCKECHKTAVRKRDQDAVKYARKMDRAKVVRRLSRNRWTRYEENIKKHFGIDLAQLQKIYDEQQGKCPCCFEPLPWERSDGTGTQRLHVDHCHESGHVRGALCADCNVALGRVKDSIATLKRMVIYLEACADRQHHHRHSAVQRKRALDRLKEQAA